MRNKYLKYKVLWVVYHNQCMVPQYCILSDTIVGRNIAECLKKSKKRERLDIPEWYFNEWYTIKPSTIYMLDSYIYYTYIEGFWRQSLGIFNSL